MKDLSKLRQSAKRKKDYIAYMAVFLLLAIVILEAAFVIWLPSRLKSETFFRREAVLEELIDMMDALRANLSSVKTRNSKLSGEIALTQKCLDEYAKYIRDYKQQASSESLIGMYNDVKNFETRFVTWKIGKSCVKIDKLDTVGYLQKSLENFKSRDAKGESSPEKESSKEKL